jgi:hypothetical protein
MHIQEYRVFCLYGNATPCRLKGIVQTDIGSVSFANRDGLNYAHNCIMLLSSSRIINFAKKCS